MYILIIDEFGNNEVKNVNAIPCVGDMIDWPFYANPTVTTRLFYPRLETIDKFKTLKNLPKIDVIVTIR